MGGGWFRDLDMNNHYARNWCFGANESRGRMSERLAAFNKEVEDESVRYLLFQW